MKLHQRAWRRLGKLSVQVIQGVISFHALQWSQDPHLKQLNANAALLALPPASLPSPLLTRHTGQEVGGVGGPSYSYYYQSVFGMLRIRTKQEMVTKHCSSE